MRARLMWVLLLVAAIFAMHGPVSMSRDTAPGTTVVAFSNSATSMNPMAGPGDAALSDEPTSEVHATLPSADGSPHGSQPAHESSAHILTLCLAVLMTGMAVVGGLVRLRRSQPPAVAAPTRAGRLSFRLPVLPRAPDLSALCILRI